MTNGAGSSDTLVLKFAVTSEGYNMSLVLKESHAASHHCNFIVVVVSNNKWEVCITISCSNYIFDYYEITENKHHHHPPKKNKPRNSHLLEKILSVLCEDS